jgi:hypothetical protein
VAGVELRTRGAQHRVSLANHDGEPPPILTAPLVTTDPQSKTMRGLAIAATF